jgi:hypothetical protein
MPFSRSIPLDVCPLSSPWGVAILQAPGSYCSRDVIEIKVEGYFVLVTALQHNTTLKSVNFLRQLTIRLDDDEDRQMAALLKTDVAWERFPGLYLENCVGGMTDHRVRDRPSRIPTINQNATQYQKLTFIN